MHELSIATSLLELLNDQQDVGTYERVKRAKVKVGPLSGVDGHALQFAFDLLVKGTSVDNCILEIEVVPLSARCKSCCGEFEINDYVFVCPVCQDNDIELLEGDDILLSEIEIEFRGEIACPN